MKIFSFFLLAILLSACTVLPHGDTRVISKWETFEEVMEAYEKIQPYTTTLKRLEQLGFAPNSQANVRILNRAEVVDRLISVTNRHKESLPRGLSECLGKGDDCYAHEVKLRVTEDKRYGNMFADLLNFSRKVETRGWEFNAVVVLVDQLVVYKSWSGTPSIHERANTTNPLGPLQSIGPALSPKPNF